MMIDMETSIISSLSDEISGAKRYIALAENEKDIAYVKCLIAAAMDEYTHAEMLKEMAVENGVMLPENLDNEMQNIRHSLRKFQ